MEALKPCPFCGGSADLYSRGTRYGIIIYAKCDVCDAQTRAKTAKGDPYKDDGFWEQMAAESVITLWNSRAT